MPHLAILIATLGGPINADLSTLNSSLAQGKLSSVELTQFYIERADDLDTGLQGLRSILARNPRALNEAQRLDDLRAEGTTLGPLHGIPILIKDNVETSELPTTAGSLSLQDNQTRRDAPIVARLRSAGAIILGKSNLSEWANIRSPQSTSGWSAIGGLTRNPYDRDRSACGSSSGSGAAVAADLAAAAIGTETDGSITCPAAMNGLVGFKPTVGLLPRTHIVPISNSQDTPGPMTRTVRDAAIMMTIMAGSDPADEATKQADAHSVDFASQLDTDSLKGARLGILWFHTDWCTDPQLSAFERNLEALRQAGAELVDIRTFSGMEEIHNDELKVLLHELKRDMNAYLHTLPDDDGPKSIEEVIAFNSSNADREMPYFGQEFFEMAAATNDEDDAAYRLARKRNLEATGLNGIDRLMADNNVIALIAPTTGPAFEITLGSGDQFAGSATTLPAVSGYPHLTVPAGMVNGLPVGLSFIGSAWSDARILSLGYAFEQLDQWRSPPLAP